MYQIDNTFFLSYLSCLRLSEDSSKPKCVPCSTIKVFCHLFLFFAAAPRHVAVTNGSGRTGTTTELSCTFEGRPLPNIKWLAFGGDLTQVSKKANFSFLHYCIRTASSSKASVSSQLKVS